MAADSPALSPATVVVHAGRPPHEPDQPLNAPITMASTYVAGGDLEYGRYGNPTWTAFEEALGALEGGRAWRSPPAWPRSRPSSTWSAQGALVVAPRHSYHGTLGQLADLEARGRLTAVLVDITDTDGRGRGPARTRPWSGSSRRPTPPSRSPTSGARRGRARRRRPRRRRQHLRHPAAAAAARARRRHRRALGDQVPRRPQRRAAGCARGPRRGRCTTCSRAAAT